MLQKIGAGDDQTAAGIDENPDEPIWDLLARYLRDRKSIAPRKLNVPRLIGVKGNRGLA